MRLSQQNAIPRILMLQVVLVLAITFGTTAQASNKKNLAQLRQGPIEFRCDSMKVLSKPNRSICQKNVVVRRGDLLVCCSEFTGYADTDWSWKSFLCKGDVRAQRSGEISWSETASFNLKTSNLILRGMPLLKRGKSYLKGTRISLNVQTERAHVHKPRGFMTTSQDAAPASFAVVTGELPQTCPLPKRPTH